MIKTTITSSGTVTDDSTGTEYSYTTRVVFPTPNSDNYLNLPGGNCIHVYVTNSLIKSVSVEISNDTRFYISDTKSIDVELSDSGECHYCIDDLLDEACEYLHAGNMTVMFMRVIVNGEYITPIAYSNPLNEESILPYYIYRVPFSVTYPPSLIWAFNSNYIDIAGSDSDTLDIFVGDYKITAMVYNGCAHVYISNLLQMMFTDPKSIRCMQMTLKVEGADESVVNVIWGALELGDRFSSYGVFHYDDDKAWQQRDIQCFVNLPFTVQLLLVEGNLLYYRREGNTKYLRAFDITHTAINEDPIVSTTTLCTVKGSFMKGKYTVFRQDFETPADGGTFDETYDYTFRTPKDTCVITRLHPRTEKEGFYLRWVDRFGFIEYYLFDNDKATMKTSFSSSLRSESLEFTNLSFDCNSRPVYIDTENTIKLCASNLNPETLDYVKDIVKSPLVDLYMGTTKDGTDIWKPVYVSSGSFTVNTHHAYLQDFEIEVNLQNQVAQIL